VAPRLHVRPAVAADLEAIAELQVALWPDGTREEHAGHIAAILAGTPPSTLPLVLFVADLGSGPIAFIEVGLRSHADGCDTVRPVGFVEGWAVAESHRGQGLGRALMEAAEAWARTQDCHEMASDTWLDSDGSQRAHAALGFEVVDRCVHFKKTLV
jgi:aminoglycoside 6'-N-acetyltransferase I